MFAGRRALNKLPEYSSRDLTIRKSVRYGISMQNSYYGGNQALPVPINT